MNMLQDSSEMNAVMKPAAIQLPLKAYAQVERLNLKLCSQQFTEYEQLQQSNTFLVYRADETGRFYLFRFGVVIFLGMTEAQIDRVLTAIPEGAFSESTWEDLEEDDFVVEVGGDEQKLSFCTIHIPQFDEEALAVIAQVIAKSALLQVQETEARLLSERSETAAQLMQKGGWTKSRRKKVIRFLGEALETRHKIRRQLSSFNSPESTWENESLYRLYFGLREHLDIEDRIDEVEKLLELALESAHLQLEALNTSRSEVLEWIIILLIALELIKFW